jgi:thiol peroxidase
MIYSVPSLDTPVCTLQTKQIEAASAAFPQHHFVIVSHDTPFALDRFCTDKNITNILTLSDARDTSFARQNGLYMEEYRLMTRAILIINQAGEVLYVDYADEVTGAVDLINAFAYLETQLPDTATVAT